MIYRSGTAERAVAKQIGRNLARCLDQSGASQNEIAKVAELHRTHLRLIKSGVRLPQIDTVLRLASALDVDPAELLRGVQWDPARKAFYIDGKRAPS